MLKVYHKSDAVLCPLGDDSESVFERVLAGTSALKTTTTGEHNEFPVALLTAQQNLELELNFPKELSRFEKMCCFVIKKATVHCSEICSDKKTVIILSSTKGNISLLDQKNQPTDVNLYESALKIARFFNNPTTPQVVSVACISGVAAQILAKRLLENDIYQHAIIVACDEVSNFVRAGFQSFQALSSLQCKPFDSSRKGLNLGEAAACMVLSNSNLEKDNPSFFLAGGAITNDANHLSGPSKTGAELGLAISQALTEAQILPPALGFVSAHGTATNYNDEMESKAIAINGITVPVNSLKPHFGHTLGAAGLLETIISLQALKNGYILGTLGFQNSNVSGKIHVLSESIRSSSNNFVKTAAGFGGCNAAIVWSK